MVPCKSTAEEVSFEWSHHRISSTDSKVRTTLHVSIIDSGRERVKILGARAQEKHSNGSFLHASVAEVQPSFFKPTSRCLET